MSVDTLMRRLDRLDHTERHAELVAHVRGLPPAQADDLGRALGLGDGHRRCLGLLVAQLRADLEPAWAALEDPSLSVRRIAARAIGRRADSIPASLVDRLDPVTLGVIVRHVLRDGRSEIAEALVDILCQRDRLAEAACLMSACSPEVIAARLDTVAWPDALWVRLAKHQPALMVQHIGRAFEEAAERHDLIWRRFESGVWISLAEREPATLADWIDRFADPDTLPLDLDELSPLIRWSPARVVGWLQTRVVWLCRAVVPRVLARGIRELDDSLLGPLCESLLQVDPLRFKALLAELSWPRRGALFEAATASLSLEHIEWPLPLLDSLPHWLREREAERMLGLARAEKDASWRRELLGRLAIEQARPRLEQEGKAASAIDRAEAHAALVRCTALSRRGMTPTLAWLQRIRNEQDPVRLGVIGALSRIPGHLFDDRDALDAVVAPVFEARDTSYGTRAAVAALAKNLIMAQATTPTSAMFDLGVSLLSRLAGQAGTLDLPLLYRNLPRGAEQPIVDALMPWLEADQKRQREQGISRLWTALGKRAWEVASLGGLIEQMIWHGHKSSAGHAAERWIEDPRTRDVRVHELVKRDRSALYLHGVFEHCHCRRQSLLHDRFNDTAPRGRFHDGKVVVIPFVDRGMSRWTPDLQRRYLDLIGAAEKAPKRYSRTRAALVGMRARVPLTRVADLEPSLRSEDVNVVEAALGGLVWTDCPAPALPVLLEHLDGDRARVAMYAMPRLARLVPAQAMVEALSTLLERPRLKITVHKEALRLLGLYPTEAAVDLLLRAWSQPLHRDVRIAALHAARSVLGQPQAWELLESAATHESVDVARGVVEVSPGNIAQAHRARYVAVMARVADHADPTARAALFVALSQGWAVAAVEPTVRLAAKVIGRLDPLDPWRQAVSLLVEGTRSTATHMQIAGLVGELLDAAAADVAPAGERDQMPYQRMLATVNALSAARHPSAAALLERVAESLTAHGLGWLPGVRARVAATDNESLGSVVLGLLQRAPTATSGLAVGHAAVAAAQQSVRNWSSVQASSLVDALADGPPPARSIAARILATFGPRWGWSGPWTDRLARLRRDEDHDVQAAARMVWIANA